ncbi:uncharacterized protein [Spinacia oleracea]|uniref:Uncharacterized protein n=1 Tax=Spinacia oleracea TaxID=3562 RepID=A0ABM3QX94_SPIOL|nr:uncharacterized protein LOC130462992 [Spinacia oleracea]
MWKYSHVFHDIVIAAWNTPIVGSKMYTMTSKLKKVKAVLKELNGVGFSDIQAVALSAYQAMLVAQEAMHHNPTDQLLADRELDATNVYRVKNKAYLKFLKQKAKVDWIKAGDENTTIFHQSIRSRNVQNQVYSIHDLNGVWKDDHVALSEAFVSYYKTLLGTTHAHKKSVVHQIVHIGPVCSSDHKAILNCPYTVDEIKEALFSIKDCGSDITVDALDVLQSGKLLKEVNHTVITLIPKTKYPRNVSDFRTFSCYSSGLQANKAKSFIYCYGMTDTVVKKSFRCVWV